ncbi:type II toxin-antitoxin system HicB family antitoxin [Candidatus Micrarchaeota archaeon]|nr:type II toxin-antitoxin system HicB family antitoxin [Candidatus Micrarchaeota archaeon]
MEKKFHVVLEAQEEGGFVAYVPELPGCHTQGETRNEALENIRQAKELYLETVKGRKASLPHVEVRLLPG